MDFPQTCSFCDSERLEPQMLFETRNFCVVADLHPLVEGHMLIVARTHLPRMAAIPAAQTEELMALKTEVGELARREYGPPSFFEHGEIGHTESHAHLHIVPSAPSVRSHLAPNHQTEVIDSWAALRAWSPETGPYLYIEDAEAAWTLAAHDLPSGFIRGALATAWGRSPEVAPNRAAAASLRARWRQQRIRDGDGATPIIVCFLEKDGRVCLLKRSEKVDGARGMWHGVAGYLPRGVEPIEHALTEVREETGLGADQLRLEHQGAPVTLGPPGHALSWRIHPFIFSVLEGEPRLNWEHVDLAWVQPHEMAFYPCVPWLPSIYASMRAERARR